MNSDSSNETKERLLKIGEDLIYRGGIGATGMDLLVKTSGVARKSIYRYFGTKEALVVEILKRRDRNWMRWFESEVNKADSPAEKLLRIFDVLCDWFTSENFRGCAFINTAGETGDPEDPVRLVDKEHKEKLKVFLFSICEEYGTADPEALARQFLILIDGAITVAHLLGDNRSAVDAKTIAQQLLNR
ncbi:TetR/AcrR family transcriptional regulator [Pseudomonas asiatica]|uniref:TetR/AcrR family transcriptional regulator n=1 Tax=Pseudomonas TaxID=286 RepID=UPI000A1EC727|nr:TetR/AcrR family transcriptional regulator [Pseudomonas sp. B14(2017)]